MPGPSLGGGASGEVFRARDQQTGAQVALKVVNPAVFPTPIAVERASRELRQLSRVTSERIARIIDFGKAADGRFFVATELIEGVSLQQLVTREGPVPVGRARAFILQIGEALTEAQKAGVIHRDVAPKNVLVTEGDRVRVINFSVPRPVSEKIFGVPEFLSPEQAEGKSVDQRSNIYSLGAILYFLVVGEPPFVGADVRAVCELHMKGTVQPPSARKPGLPPELDRVVLKALEKNSSRRHLTLRQLLSEIETIAGDGAGADAARARTMYAASGNPTPAPARSPLAATPAPSPPAPGPPGAAPLPHPAAGAGAVASPPRITAQAGTLGGGQAPTKTVQTAPLAPPAAAPPGTAPPGAAGAPIKGGFRETLWFKKGEVDEFIAQNTAAQPAGAPGPERPAEDIRPLEDRYVDDGSVSAEDRQKFSLRTGGAAQFGLKPGALPSSVPGERMSEQEMINEIHSGRRVGVFIAIGIGVLVLVVLGWLVLGRSRGSPKSSGPATAPPAVAKAPAPTPPAPGPPASPTLSPPAPAAVPAGSTTLQPAAPPDPAPSPAPSLHAAKPKPGELMVRAQRALQRGRLTAPAGDCAVDLLDEARKAGAAPAALRKVETRVVKLLDVKARRDMKRRAFREAQDSFSGILKLRPDDRAAAAGLRDAERKLKK
ncbi:MAG TPA: serine/threonine-protein kinase [Polyangia bacterium]|nr:serine/threonine-protein kinase [Polyangia bacterium]